ncbi:hypothetical protein EDC01DRAFT_608826 [Geopyxis carbonaria]|nr:hypothetical protein EDC01DRAFT_608826 [Geopyxis carbonaria]
MENQGSLFWSPQHRRKHIQIIVSFYIQDAYLVLTRFAGYSNFHPWRGGHPEDIVSDSQARNGQYDRLHTEQASARFPLSSTFKQRGGLPILSSLCRTALVRRQSRSQVSMNSTFKPPPRVTLPDSRRESWLRDLANPLVALRRLARTIPHGMKGLPLLEQCAAKNVPVERAVWFVRCVGANELRGLKRKGVGSLAVGGESKWIREWSIQITQFLDKALSNDGISSSTYDRLLYIVRFVSYLFADGLLDRGIFLDWYISLLELSSTNKLPLVISLGSIFWQDILKLRKNSRRVSELLLGKLHLMNSICMHVYSALARRIDIVITAMLLDHRRSLVLHTDRYNIIKTLSSFVHNDERLRLCHLNVAFRLNAIDTSCSPYAVISQQVDLRKLVDSLDCAKAPEEARKILHQFSSNIAASTLIQCLGEWAVSSLRTGTHRTYLVVPLLRSAYQYGSYNQDPIMSFLENFDARSKGLKCSLYFLISELVRDNVFSVAIYMKWLISRGFLSRVDIMDEKCPSHVHLLTQVPIHNLSPRLRKLRRILLAGCGFSSEAEENYIISAKELLTSLGIFDPHRSVQKRLNSSDLETFRGFSRTVKSEIGLWIRDNIRDHVVMKQRPAQHDCSTQQTAKSINISQFLLIRQVLETFDDYAVASQILKIMMDLDSCDILTMCIDTLICNAKPFTALGHMDNFVQTLFTKYKILRSRRNLEKEFVYTFLEMLNTTVINNSIRFELETELVNFDQKYSRSTVPSPRSESVDVGDDAHESNEEIEQLWSSNLSLDRSNLTRIFETTVSKMEASFEEVHNQHSVVLAARGLIKLRQFNAAIFDDLTMGWIIRMRYCPNRMSLFRAFAILISESCINIVTLIQIALTTKSSESLSTNVTRSSNLIKPSSCNEDFKFCIRVLELVVCGNTFEASLTLKELFTLKRKRILYIQSSPAKILDLYRHNIELCANSHDGASEEHLQAFITSTNALDLLRELVPNGLDLINSRLVDPLLGIPHTGSVRWLQLLVNGMMHDQDLNELDDLHVQVARLFNLANDFSIDICKTKMRIIFHAGGQAAQSEQQSSLGHTIARSFIRGIASADPSRRKNCLRLVSVVNRSWASRIRGDAEELFLNPSSFMRSHRLSELLEIASQEDHETGAALALAISSVIEETSRSVSRNDLSCMPNLLVDRLARLLQSISAQEYEVEKVDHIIPELPWRSRAARQELQCWVVAFVRLIMLHLPSFMYGKGYLIDQIRILFGLNSLLLEDFLQDDELHQELILDIAGGLTMGLPDDYRAQLRRFAKGRRLPPLMDYLIGYIDCGESLRTIQRGKTSDYHLKAWERLAEPTPAYGDNDTSISLRLFKTRRSI